MNAMTNEGGAQNLNAQARAERAGQAVMAARLALKRNQRDEAKKLLAQALKTSPGDIGALELLGDLFMEEAEQEKAIQVFAHGLKAHPHHAPFEEKMALAKLDLAEMERDKIAREQFIETGDTEKWLDKKPHLAMGLSVLVPGAGQFYNDHIERAAVFFGLALATLCGWFYPLSNKFLELRRLNARAAPGFEDCLAAMSDGTRFFFWVMLVGWLMVYVLSAYDAALGASRFNEARRQHLGI
jgi:tetratricopeptide (TPR) repeat protein